MSRLDDIDRQLAAYTHASQLRAPVVDLVKEVRELRKQVDTLLAKLTEPEPEPEPEDEVPPPRKRQARRATAE